jgi:hypothetical protein
MNKSCRGSFLGGEKEKYYFGTSFFYKMWFKFSQELSKKLLEIGKDECQIIMEDYEP